MERYQVSAKAWGGTMVDLDLCFERWGVGEWLVAPGFAGARTDSRWCDDPEEARVTISWADANGIPVSMGIATFHTMRENFRAAYLNVNDMRLIERRGGAEAMTDAYLRIGAGTMAPAVRDPYEVLGTRPDSPIEVHEAAYKVLAKGAHSDLGGDDDAMTELNQAIEAVRAAALMGREPS